MSQSGLVSWSTTAASNGTADANVNWAEGMAPSAINDSARAMMASAAKYYGDINGAIVTGGTSTAYTVTSNQSFVALTAGYMVAFTPHATNGGTTTLAVDGLTAKPLRSAPGVEIASGVLILGTPYLATYYTSNSGEWILHGFYSNPYNIPLGGMMDYVGTSAPNSAFVLPYGQAISRTTYATLFSLVSTTFGVGDGGSTFNVPDLRGRVVAGHDAMGGNAASRLTVGYFGANGGIVGNAGGLEQHTLTTAQSPGHTHTGTTGNNSNGHQHTFSATSGTESASHTHTTNAGASTVQVNAGSGTTVPQAGSTASGAPSALHTHSVSGTTGDPDQNHTHGFTTDSGTGGGAAHNNVQPTMVLSKILRIL